MKSIPFFILILFWLVPAKAQTSYMVEAGFHINAISPSGLNTVLSRYNRSIGNNSEPFPLINQMHGFSIQTGLISGWMYFEAGYHYQTKNTQAVDRRFQFNEIFEVSPIAKTGSLGFGWVMKHDQFWIIPGFRAYSGKLRIMSTKSSIGNPQNFTEEELYSSWFSEGSFFVRIVLPFVTVEPYYTMSINRLLGNGSIYNLAELNRQLNPTTHQFDGRQVPYDASGFGIRVTFGFWSTFF